MSQSTPHTPAGTSTSGCLAYAPLPAPTVLDVEASGFGRNSYPIEIGFVLPNGHAYCSLVKPEAHWTHWDVQAEIHF